MRSVIVSIGLLLVGASAHAQTAPAGWHEETRPRVAPIVGGALMFGVPYLAGVAGALANPNSTLDPAGFYIPVLGPFVELAFMRTADGFDPAALAVVEVGLVLDGALQAFGLGLMLYGVAAPKRVLVHNVVPVPLVGRVNGLGLAATF